MNQPQTNKYTCWFRKANQNTWNYGVEVATPAKALELQNYAVSKHPGTAVRITSTERDAAHLNWAGALQGETGATL